jgi:hypothetical protein
MGRAIKSRKIKLEEHVALMEKMEDACKCWPDDLKGRGNFRD